MKDNCLGRDILKEIFNVSVGQAANMLSEITGKKILLDVPIVEILGMDKNNGDMIKTFLRIPEG